MTKRKARAYIVTDYPIVRDCLVDLINRQPDLRAYRGSTNRANAFAKIGAVGNRGVLLVFLGCGAALKLVKKMKKKHPQVRIIILSNDDDQEYAERVFRAGACGLIPLRETTKSILTGIRKVLAGGICAREEIIAGIIRSLGPRPRGVKPSEASPSRLSDREFEVFRLLGKGVRTVQIARDLDLSIKTVQAFCQRIRKKMGLGKHINLLRAAFRWEVLMYKE